MYVNNKHLFTVATKLNARIRLNLQLLVTFAVRLNASQTCLVVFKCEVFPMGRG